MQDSNTIIQYYIDRKNPVPANAKGRGINPAVPPFFRKLDPVLLMCLCIPAEKTATTTRITEEERIPSAFPFSPSSGGKRPGSRLSSPISFAGCSQLCTPLCGGKKRLLGPFSTRYNKGSPACASATHRQILYFACRCSGILQILLSVFPVKNLTCATQSMQMCIMHTCVAAQNEEYNKTLRGL